jgi:Arc/MetJ-type ribon-helix-helix transcriptional regulator
MGTAKKITVHVPESLLAEAQRSTGQGITETIRRGLQLVAASEAYKKLRALRGKVSITLDIESLREDRE